MSAALAKSSPDLKAGRARIQAMIVMGILAFLTLIAIPVAIIERNTAGYILIAACVVSDVLCGAGIMMIRRNQIHFGISLVVNAIQLALVLIARVIHGIGIPLAISILVLTIGTVLVSLEERKTTTLIVTGIITGFLALVVSTFPFSFLHLQQFSSDLLSYIAYLFMALQIGLILILFIRKYIILSLQIKLLMAFILVTLIPVGIIAWTSITTSTNVVRQQASQSLLVAGKETASVIDLFFQTNLTSIRSEVLLYPSIVTYMNLPEEKRGSGIEQINVQNVLQSLLSKDPINILSYALLDKNGKDIMDTYLGGVGQDELKRDYFQTTVQNSKAYITPVEFITTQINTMTTSGAPDLTTETPVITFAAPIFNGNGEILGIIRAQYKADVFLVTLKNNQNLVSDGSYPILFDENHYRLADPAHPDAVNKFLVAPTATALKTLKENFRVPNTSSNQLASNQPALYQQLKGIKDNSFLTTSDLTAGVKEVGAEVVLKSRPWTIVYFQKEASILQPVTQQTQTTLLVVYFIAAITGMLAILVSNWLARPIGILTATAQRISSGDLQAQAEVKTGDEIEVLARTFNLMTAQLRTFISGLEERVQQRTQELAQQTQRAVYRAAQIQTLADVARAITSVQDLEELLLSVTRLTSERFSFYHVGIFLVDPAGEYAILRAANSEGGQHMLARQHRLKIGQVGIVGNVAASSKPRVATDVGQDATYFNNPDLPLTRSEMALPLITAGKVIGVLDVQSTATNAFSDEDLSLFATLADQVAVAIVNNRLYAETRQALAEAEEIHRKYLRREWETEIAENPMQGYQYDMHGLTSIAWQNTAEIDIAVRRGETVTVSHSGEVVEDLSGQSHSALAVPIMLRGEVIGVIDLQDTDASREWFKEEIDVVQAVADQVAVALENARLFEQTVRRAEREKKVLDITGKIRATNDPQIMIRTAISELQQVLRASRAQILLQPSQPIEEAEVTDNNHHHNNGHH